VGGIAGYAVLKIQERLQAKNKLLEQAVERGTLQLQEQEQELKQALEIQKNLLPKELPQLPGMELAGAWQPARTVGGDYFDVLRLDDNRIGICVGDVSGKGLTASLLMANLQAAFRAYAMPDASPAMVCGKLNAFVCGNVAPGKFISFFYGILDGEKKTFTYESAGHCPGILVHAGGQSELLSGQGGVLGVQPEWTYQDFTIRLASGDRLLLYTDGVSEAANKDAEEFGYQRIAAAAASARASAADCHRRVMEEVMKFCGGEFGDDVTLVAAAVH
jgi:sigma-B regulation protein RsbU (phosphoserine phosphatase)